MDKQSKGLLTTDEKNLLGRTALSGLATGSVAAGSLGLLYFLVQAIQERSDSARRLEHIDTLSPFLPVPGSEAIRENPFSEAKTSSDKGWVNDFLTGGIMYPATALAAVVPSYMIFNWLSGRRQSAETKRLHRELENARDDFSLALTEGTKVSQQIDDYLEQNSNTKQSAGKPKPPQYRQPADTVGSSGWVGGIGGGLALAGTGAGLLAFMALNRYLKANNKNVNTISAMNELQRRRKAISEIAPDIEVAEAPTGKLYIDY